MQVAWYCCTLVSYALQKRVAFIKLAAISSVNTRCINVEKYVKLHETLDATLLVHYLYQPILFYSINALQYPALKVYSDMCCSLRIT